MEIVFLKAEVISKGEASFIVRVLDGLGNKDMRVAKGSIIEPSLPMKIVRRIWP